MATANVILPRELKTYLGAKNASSLKCFHLNTRSAKNKSADLELFLHELDVPFDVIMLSETWYKSDSDVFKLPDYNTHSVNRPSRRGGGVAMLINKLVSYDLLSQFCLSTDDYEVLSVIVDEHVVSVFYRPQMEIF